MIFDIIPTLVSRHFYKRIQFPGTIGWALRQRARLAPSEVQAYVRRSRGQLAPLSCREALSLEHVGDGVEEVDTAADLLQPSAKRRRVLAPDGQ